jgi:hypothetical protein
MLGGNVVDGDMQDGEEASKGRSGALHALEGLVVVVDAVFDLSESAKTLASNSVMMFSSWGGFSLFERKKCGGLSTP